MVFTVEGGAHLPPSFKTAPESTSLGLILSLSKVLLCVCVCVCVCFFSLELIYFKKLNKNVYCIYIYFSIIGYYKILSIVPCAIQ